MEIIRTYQELQRIEEALEDQVQLTKHELYMWYGIDIDDDQIKAYGGKFAMLYGMNSAVKQAEYRFDYLVRVNKMLQAVKLKKKKLKETIESLDGLDGQIVFKRLAEHKTFKEIAEDLGYSERHIQRRWKTLQGKQETSAVE